jgi:hypothetical protein
LQFLDNKVVYCVRDYQKKKGGKDELEKKKTTENKYKLYFCPIEQFLNTEESK